MTLQGLNSEFAAIRSAAYLNHAASSPLPHRSAEALRRSAAGRERLVPLYQAGRQDYDCRALETNPFAMGALAESGIANVECREAYMEELPVPDGWADVVISNGVLNLTPDKQKAVGEMFRVLRSGGRLQIGDILVNREVPEGAKKKIDLWTG